MPAGRTRLTVAAFALLAAASGCDGLFGNNDSSDLENGDAGATCEKDREVLSEILVQPRSCSTTAECPTGSFCNGEGQCDWQCYTDSDCGFGSQCSCEGMCLDGDPPDPGPEGDPACARDLELLSPGGSALERRCVLDEHCPLGARCDEVTHWCRFDCASNSDCDELAGEVCDCRGACVVPGQEPEPELPGALPSAEVVPSHMPVPDGFGFGAQTFSVVIESSEPVPAGMVPRAYVEIVGPRAPFDPPDVADTDPLDLGLVPAAPQTVAFYRGIPLSETEADSALAWVNSASSAQISSLLGLSSEYSDQVAAGAPYASLDEFSAGELIDAAAVQALKMSIQNSAPTACTGPGPRSIALGDADFDVDTSGGFRAVAAFSVARCEGDVASGPAWTIAVSAYLEDGSTAPPVRRPLDYQLLSMGPDGIAPVVDSVPATGMFEGVLVEQDPVAGLPLTVPVRAWATNGDQLVVFDDARLLSATGRFNLSMAGDRDFVVLAPAGDESEIVTGRARWLDDDSGGGIRRGSMEIILATTSGHSTRFEYTLRRSGDPGHPYGGPDSELAQLPLCGSCDGGSVCEPALGRCLPEVMQAWALTSTVQHASEEAWRAGATFLEAANVEDSRAHRVSRLLCYDYPDTIAAGAPISAFRFADDPERVAGVAGDTACWDGTLDPSFQAQSAVGLATTDPSVPTSEVVADLPADASAWLKECLENLSREPMMPANTSVELQATSWFGNAPGACANLSQLIPALGLLAHMDLEYEHARRLDRSGATLLQRLLAQWLDVRAFTVSQGIAEIEANGSLATGPGASGADWTDIRHEQLLAIAEDGWDLLLDATYAQPLDRLERDVIRYPDYRMPRPDAYWSFFHEAGATDEHIIDRVGDHHANFVQTPDFQRVHLACESYVRIGPDSRAFLPTNELRLADDITVSFWLKPDQPHASSYKYATVLDDYWGGLRVYLTQKPTSQNGEWTLNVGNHAGTFTMPWQSDLSWSHIAITRRDRMYRVLLNGTAITSWTAPSIAEYVDNQQLVLGNNWYYPDFSYGLDELAIWSRALGDADIALLHEGGRGTGSSKLCSGTRHPILAVMDQLEAPQLEPEHEQGVGLPVKIVETASIHARAVEAYAGEELAGIYGTCYLGNTSAEQQAALERASQSLRYVVTARELASDLYRRSGELTCIADQECQVAGASSCSGGYCVDVEGERFFTAPEAWDERYLAAVDELTAAHGRAADAVAALARCDNPLGISEDALPLYFGDVAGDNSRFFAASDYMLDGQARPAVNGATSSLEAARTAWLSQRQSQVQQMLTDTEYERRLENLEIGSMREVIDACGIDDVDALDVLDSFEANEMTLSNCWRVPGCTENDATCLRGQLGAAVLAMRDASYEIHLEQRASERRYVEWMAAADVARQHQDIVDEALQAIDDYKETAETLRQRGKGLLGRALGSVLPDQLVDAVTDVIGPCTSNPTSCLSALVSTDFGAAEDLEEAREAIDFRLQELQFQSQLIDYYAEVERRQRDYEYGLDVMEARRIDFEQAALAFQDQLRRASRALSETRAALDREQARNVPSVAHHYWLDEKVDRFRSELERARRLTFLSLLALEYEFQQSFDLRSEILSATHPGQLLDVLESLDAQRATRSINARRPAAGTEVLSLRKDILELAELDDARPGERTDDSTRRLQSRLTSHQRAVYAPDGRYLGQAISFTVLPKGALAHRCAERLWRVTATIQGDLTEVDEPGTNVFLRKRNVFESQWCTGLGDGGAMQQGSIHGTNLFDPSLTNDSVSYEFATARLYPWFNVRRSDFFRDEYTEGASEELAGRGLYGDYVLLFPYEGMLEPPTDCDFSSNPQCVDIFRDLSKVEDVLIRFDYYSVDDLLF